MDKNSSGVKKIEPGARIWAKGMILMNADDERVEKTRNYQELHSVTNSELPLELEPDASFEFLPQPRPSFWFSQNLEMLHNSFKWVITAIRSFGSFSEIITPLIFLIHLNKATWISQSEQVLKSCVLNRSERSQKGLNRVLAIDVLVTHSQRIATKFKDSTSCFDTQ